MAFTAGNTSKATVRTRTPVTLKTVQMMVPAVSKHDSMVATYGLEPVDYHGIREKTEEHVVRISNELHDNLNEKALEIFMQRVVGSFVMGAYGAALFYGTKRSDAQAMRTRLLNDDGDGDRDGVAGFQSKAERACVFAAELGLQAYALTAAAEGAVDAYAHITGNEWKPYEGNQPAPSTTSRKALDAMMEAL